MVQSPTADQHSAPTHGFARAEFELRLSRAQRSMSAYEFDGLLFTLPHNIRWATGFDTQFWESPTRPWFVLLPAHGEPIAIVPEIGAPQMAETWVSDIRSWSSPHPSDDGHVAAGQRAGCVATALRPDWARTWPGTRVADANSAVS